MSFLFLYEEFPSLFRGEDVIFTLFVVLNKSDLRIGKFFGILDYSVLMRTKQFGRVLPCLEVLLFYDPLKTIAGFLVIVSLSMQSWRGVDLLEALVLLGKSATGVR